MTEIPYKNDNDFRFNQFSTDPLIIQALVMTFSVFKNEVLSDTLLVMMEKYMNECIQIALVSYAYPPVFGKDFKFSMKKVESAIEIRDDIQNKAILSVGTDQFKKNKILL